MHTLLRWRCRAESFLSLGIRVEIIVEVAERDELGSFREDLINTEISDGNDD